MTKSLDALRTWQPSSSRRMLIYSHRTYPPRSSSVQLSLSFATGCCCSSRLHNTYIYIYAYKQTRRRQRRLFWQSVSCRGINRRETIALEREKKIETKQSAKNDRHGNATRSSVRTLRARKHTGGRFNSSTRL